MVGVSLGKQT